MAKDYKIERIGEPGEYDLALGPANADGLRDLIVVEGNDEVVQHLEYRLQVWLGESPYDRSAGVPYNEGVFSDVPLEGIAGLFQSYIVDTDGIEGMDPLGALELSDDAVLTLNPVVYLEDGSQQSITVEVSP